MFLVLDAAAVGGAPDSRSATGIAGVSDGRLLPPPSSDCLDRSRGIPLWDNLFPTCDLNENLVIQGGG
jgi:hypothetical protein